MYTRLLGLLVILLIAGTASAQSPLAPVDTSSPRATMESFLSMTEEVGPPLFRLPCFTEFSHATTRFSGPGIRLCGYSI